MLIPIAQPLLDGNELAYVTDCVKTGWISSLGRYVREFEAAFARFCGVRHGIATSNGTTALHLALAAFGVGPGDEVIVPSLTFVATANAVAYTRAKAVFVDSEAETWNLDPAQVEAKITSRTKAIIPVHLHGHPCDMDPLLELARRYGLQVIEDAAEAHGAEYKGRRVGSLGDTACFSFYGNKLITTGEGGMITTSDDGLAQKARLLRDQGMSSEKPYWHPVIGYNYRMTNLQAAIGLAQLERIEGFIESRWKIARLYQERLQGVPGLTLPREAPWAKSVHWVYGILLEGGFGLGRDELRLRLGEKGIETRPFFYPIHTMPPYNQGERLPVAEDLASRGIMLPSFAAMTEEHIHYIRDALYEEVRQAYHPR